jgi:hypothetical protein
MIINQLLRSKKMKEKKNNLSRWLFWIAGLVLILGAIVSMLLFMNSNFTKYPGLIEEAYAEQQHHLRVPGSMDVKLSRTGAYGIYYEYNPLQAGEDITFTAPPAIDCSLISKSTGVKLAAVPDFVENNRYWLKDQEGSGVLIMSITIENPDSYTFTCDYQDGSQEPEIMVALGPNYVWEFLKTAWEIGLPLLGAIAILCGSVLLALILFISGIIIKAIRTT